MNAGELREQIIILKPTTTTNEYGEQVQNYVEYCRTRAKIEWNGSNRTTSNNEIVYNLQRIFHIRYYVKIDGYDMIVWNNQKYRILNIDKIREYNKQIITTELINE